MPALFTSMSMRPWRSSTPSTIASTDAVSVTSSDADSALPPARANGGNGRGGIVAPRRRRRRARRARRAPRRYRARSRATRRSRSRLFRLRSNMQRRPRRGPRAIRNDVMRASGWIFLTRPLSTVPGPTSTYVVTPSDARRRTTASQRTGADTCRTSASIARCASRFGSRIDVGDDRHARVVAPSARAAPARAAPRPASSARSGTARSPAAGPRASRRAPSRAPRHAAPRPRGRQSRSVRGR